MSRRRRIEAIGLGWLREEWSTGGADPWAMRSYRWRHVGLDLLLQVGPATVFYLRCRRLAARELFVSESVHRWIYHLLVQPLHWLLDTRAARHDARQAARYDADPLGPASWYE